MSYNPSFGRAYSQELGTQNDECFVLQPRATHSLGRYASFYGTPVGLHHDYVSSLIPEKLLFGLHFGHHKSAWVGR